MSLILSVNKNGKVEKYEVVGAYKHELRKQIIVKKGDTYKGFILKKRWLKHIAQNQISSLDEKFVEKVINKENGEMFFLNGSEAEKIDISSLKLENKTFIYDYSDLVKSIAKIFK